MASDGEFAMSELGDLERVMVGICCNLLIWLMLLMVLLI